MSLGEKERLEEMKHLSIERNQITEAMKQTAKVRVSSSGTESMMASLGKAMR